MSELRHNITALREERGVSKAHLARQVGVSRGYVTRLENGSLQPGAAVMLRLARYFRRPVEEVFQLAATGSSAAYGGPSFKADASPLRHSSPLRGHDPFSAR